MRVIQARNFISRHSRCLSHPRLPSAIIAAIELALCMTFVLFICQSGIPSLRHDWDWPPSKTKLGYALWESMSGWRLEGYGNPNAYPSDYVIAIPMLLANVVVGSHGTLVLLLVGIAALCAIAAREAAGPYKQWRPLLLTFLLFNSWTYTEVVAGHLAMLVAWSASAYASLRFLNGRDSRSAYRLCLFITVVQLQYFAVSSLVAVIVAFRRLRPSDVLTWGLVASPVLLGLALESSSLAKIPFNLSWQQQQSVPPGPALALQGYFARYTTNIDGFVATMVVAAVIVSALCAALRRHEGSRWKAIAIAASLCALLATGTRGPAAPIYENGLFLAPILGLFRELYDLIGVIALAYLNVFARAAPRWPAFASLLILDAVLAASWCVTPPASYWVWSKDVPRIGNVSVGPRFALIPAFQPMSLHGRGSGADPDIYAGAGRAAAINQYLATYPENSALLEYLRRGDPSELAALGVSKIFSRPWLSTRAGSLRPQTATRLSPFTNSRNSVRAVSRFEPLPMISIRPLPAITDSLRTLGQGQIFFADAAAAAKQFRMNTPPVWQRLRPLLFFPIDRTTTDAAQTWVDGRLAFLSGPEWGQPDGGVYTASHKGLTVRPGTPLLVYINGRLTDNLRRRLSDSTHRYRWLHLDGRTHTVFCAGQCLVVAQGFPPGGTGDAIMPFTPLGYKSFLSLAYFVSPGEARGGMLELNTRFDANWLAFQGPYELPHVRVDGEANGWLLNRHAVHRCVMVIEVSACMQLAFQALGFGVIITTLIGHFRRRPTHAILAEQI